MKALARYASFEIKEVYKQEVVTNEPDGSDIWQDVVLIAEKPFLSCLGKFRETLRRFVLCKVLMSYRGFPQ